VEENVTAEVNVIEMEEVTYHFDKKGVKYHVEDLYSCQDLVDLYSCRAHFDKEEETYHEEGLCSFHFECKAEGSVEVSPVYAEKVVP